MVKSIIEVLTLLSLSIAVHSSLVIDYGTAWQCGVVEIAWTKFSSPEQLEFPLYLHILPFNSTAVTKSLDGWNASMESGSLAVDFNFAGDTPFLFGVTDANGTGVGRTSTNRTAMLSPDISCLSNSAQTRSSFEVTTTPKPSDCPSLSVKWNNTSNNKPLIIAFSPGQVPLNLVEDDSGTETNGSLIVRDAFTSLSHVIVLYGDGTTPPQTSELLTVGGTDNNNCSVGASDDIGHSKFTVPGATPGVFVGGIMAFVLMVVVIVIPIVRYQKKRLQDLSKNFPPPSPPDPSLSEEKKHTSHVENSPIPEESDDYSLPPSNRSSATSLDLDAGPIIAQRLRHTIGIIVAPKIRRPLVTRSLSSQPTVSLSESTLPPIPEISIATSPASSRRRFAFSATPDSRRPSTALGTDESYILMTGAAHSPVPLPPFEHCETLPDSPTIPDAWRNSAMPTTPKSGGSRPRSQWSEKRSQYLKFDTFVDALPSENAHKSPSTSTRASSWASWIKKTT